MGEDDKDLTRRDFLKTAAGLAAGAVAASLTRSSPLPPRLVSSLK